MSDNSEKHGGFWEFAKENPGTVLLIAFFFFGTVTQIVRALVGQS